MPGPRKLTGAVLLLAIAAFYPLLVLVAAAMVLPGASGWLQFVFYLVAGLIWVLPAGGVVSWMARDRAAPGRLRQR